jgi:anthraniloyl-CoA monooxygenase
MEPEQFTFSLLTGSQRVGHENQKLRDPKYVADFDRWFARTNGQTSRTDDRGLTPPPPPMFAPFELRGMRLENRVVVSPMCMYSAKDGMPGDFHLVHYGARGTGGAGLLFTEMTDVSAAGRISPGCTGIYTDEQAAAWKRIVDYVHAHGPTKMALQLGHAGRKAATRIPWEGGADVALDAKDAWEIVAPSPIPYWPGVSVTPREMTRADMDTVKAEFVAATKRARAAGFDMIEVHAAHGYLLSSFLSPLCNVRTDKYGGDVAARCLFPIEIVTAVREAWGTDKPLSVRISAHDWAAGGNTPIEATEIARRFKDAGADIIHVSSGQVVKNEKPVYGRMFQVPFSDRIRNDVEVPTIAVGNISEADHVNTIVAAGRADLCALARPHLADAAWTLRAAAEQGYAGVQWPVQYDAGRIQLERNLAKAIQLAVEA